ncbi:MAG: HEAT repeat domain-containing protein [Candidatus Hydrogenedentota bacterium]|nr:MAG: HEAT repeat domain-containing protein [Candidatus Hydrogenedentota bacterium]
MKAFLSFVFLCPILLFAIERERDWSAHNVPVLKKERQQLIEDAESGNPEARLRAIKRCGWWRITYCYRVLVQNLNDVDPIIRRESAEALGLLRIPAARPYIKKALEKETVTDVKARMILALGFSGQFEDAEVIQKYLKDPETTVRRHAALALGYVADNKTEKALEEALKTEKKEHLIPVILKSLLIISPENTKYQNMLIEKLFSDDIWTRFYAAEAIRDLKIKEARTALQKALSLEENKIVRRRLYDAFITVLYAD